jgi:trimeric autotransporter adhesin
MALVDGNYSGHVQASYGSFDDAAGYRQSLGLIAGQSYTRDEPIDVYRRGDFSPDHDDHINHSDRTAESTSRPRSGLIPAEGPQLVDLIMGLSGNDIIDGGQGNDFIYGDSASAIAPNPGNDTLSGGAGDDVIFGGAGNDTLIGGSGDDELWGDYDGQDATNGDDRDIADYSEAEGKITINFVGSAAGSTLTVADGEGGTDTLHSIEKIIGSTFHDTLNFSGTIPAGTVLTIDSGGGDSHDDLINLRALWSGVVFHNHTTSGSFTSSAGGTINFTNFHTDIVGSAYDDTITDDATGAKSIDGGAGNDTISVSVGAANIDGGAGDDTITGGSANDVITGGAGANILSGGDGSDRLIASGTSDVLNGGDGADMLVVTANAGSVTLRGGAGDDVIDARAHAEVDPNPLDYMWPRDDKVVLEFRAGDGHDTILGEGYHNQTPPADPWGVYDPGRSWGVDAISFPDLSIDDVTFVWDVTSIVMTPWPVWYWNALQTVSGNLAIVINSTGDSIYLGNVVGYFSTTTTGDPLSDPWIQIFGISLPDLYFGNVGNSQQSGEGPYPHNVGDAAATDWHFVNASVAGLDGAMAAFADATATPAEDTQGSDGADDLHGGSGDDSLSGAGGDDNFTASAGRDTYDGGSGNDTLTAFGSSADFSAVRNLDGTIELTDRTGLTGTSVLTSVENLEFANDSVTVSLDDFLASHPAALQGTEAADTLTGTASSDTLIGLGGNDTLSGGFGSDNLIGGAGSDTYVFHSGDGNDTIQEGYSDPADQDILQLADLLPQDVSLSVDGTPGHVGDLLIAIQSTGEVIRIENQFGGIEAQGMWLQQGIEGIQFADTTVWDRTILEANPTIRGTAGVDDLTSSVIGTTIIAGIGEDQIHAASGGCQIVYHSGDGNDVIDGTGMTIILPDINVSGVRILSSDGDLVIQITGTGETLRVLDQFRYFENGGDDLEYAGYLMQRLIGIQFADGTTLDWDGIAAAAVPPSSVELIGTNGNDRILGTFFNDAISGGEGNDALGGFSGSDVLSGDAGNDTLVGGWGDDTLHGGSGNDLLNGGEGNDTMDGGTGDDVYIVGDPGDSVTEMTGGGTDEVRTYLDQYVLPDEVENLSGSRWLGQTLTGNSSDNVISGTSGDDILYGLAGDDRFIASSGRDAYDGGSGNDTLSLFGSATDYATVRNLDGDIELTDSTGTSVLTSIENLEFTEDGVTISLDNFLAAQLSIPLQGTAGADTMNGTAGADVLIGLEGPDTFTGGGGDDVLRGGAGNDVYVFEAGDGNDSIEENLSSFNYDVLQLMDILPQHVSLTQDGTPGHVGDLLIHINSTGEVIRVAGQFIDWDTRGLEAVKFADGMVWDRAKLQANPVILGTAGDDILSSTWRGATITAGLGDDQIHSLGRADRLIYRSGDGNDVFDDTGGGWDGDKLILTDLNLADVQFVRENHDLVIQFTESGNSLRVLDQFAVMYAGNLGSAGESLSSLDSIQFADGTTLNWGEIAAAAIPVIAAFTGTSGDESILGTVYDDTISGGAGHDTLAGFGGVDVLSGDDGDDLLFGGPGDDTLSGGAGNDYLYGGAGNDTMNGGEGNDFYDVNETGDVVTELAGGGTDEIQTSLDQYVLLDNFENLTGVPSWGGQTLTGNSLGNLIKGNWTDDILNGLAGDDTLIGGQGVDLLTGGSGNDAFQFAGYDTGLDTGADRITDFTSGADIIDLTRVDANTLDEGDQAFSFIGSQSFSGAAGELRYEQNAGDTWLEWDDNGDGVADFAIVFAGSVTPVATDILL